MLNFRKLRQDFSQAILKEGRELCDKGAVITAKILHLDGGTLRVSSRVRGAFENVYESEVEIDRSESAAVDSNCDCTYTYDCQHIAAVLFYLESHLNEIVVAYSKEADLNQCDREVKKQLQQTFEEAATKEDKRKDKQFQKEVLHEYVGAARVLGHSPFFLPPEILDEDKAELAIIFTNHSQEIFDHKNSPEIQLALRLPSRSKPLYVPNVKAFLDAVRYREPLQVSGKRYYFTLNSFDTVSREMLGMLVNHARFYGSGDERYLRVAQMDLEALGTILARAHDMAHTKQPTLASSGDRDPFPMPCLYSGNLEEPLCYSNFPAQIRFSLEYLESPCPTLLLNPSIMIEEDAATPGEVLLFESAKPGLIYKNIYYRFSPHIKRVHLRSLTDIRELTIPEPLFGTFIENALPVLRQYADVSNVGVIERFVTLPYVGEVKGRCAIHYLNGELEAELFFIYDNVEIPADHSKLDFKHVSLFIGKQGILARNLVEERRMIEDIFQDFIFDTFFAFSCTRSVQL